MSRHRILGLFSPPLGGDAGIGLMVTIAHLAGMPIAAVPFTT